MGQDHFKDIKVVSLEENSKYTALFEIFLHSSDKLEFDQRCEYHIDGPILKLVNYKDGLGLPKNVTLQVHEDVGANITGYLSSPALIHGVGAVNLIVHPNLELIIKCMDPSRLDGMILSGDEEKFSDYGYGRDFSQVKRELYSAIEYSKPKIFINRDKVSAGFTSEMRNLDDVLICMKKNVVYINKSYGPANVYYHSDIEKEYTGNDAEGIRARLEKAISEEKYEDAEKLKKQLQRINTRTEKGSNDKIM